MSDFKDEQRWPLVEEALRRSQTLAAAGQYAAAVMHEINNPLEAISNLAYLVYASADEPQDVRKYINLLEQELANVISIARKTLGFYRPAGVRHSIDLASVAEAALRVHERKISAKKIKLVKQLLTDSSAEVHSGEILQVVSNLVSNAVDALPQNGTLCLRVRKSEQQVHIIIADDGPGIPHSILARIFEPFFTTKQEGGTGLGLAISKAIVESHNGKIRTRSSVREGRTGTSVRISLPREKREQAA